MISRLLLSAFISFSLLAVHAQDDGGTEESQKDDGNIIINGSFENTTSRKYKKPGHFTYVSDWSTATEEKVDLFSKFAEYPEIGVPKNYMGVSNPKDGDNYIGIAIHLVASKDGREYITSQMNEFLKKDQKYCLKYSISLADASKYASNNLGFHFSKKPVFADASSIIKDDVILPLDNGVQNVRDNWTDICISFRAKGYEKFITIGNFLPETRLVTEKMRLPVDSKLEAQNVAYYYLDDISLVPVANDSECVCKDDDEPEGPKIIYSKASALNESASVADRISSSTVYFYSNEDELASASKRDLDVLAELLMANDKLRLRIKGHMDELEVKKGAQYDTFLDLSKTRAEKVKQYLVDKGVSSYRMTVESFKDEKPATQMKTPLSLAKNRRVQFELR